MSLRLYALLAIVVAVFVGAAQAERQRICGQKLMKTISRVCDNLDCQDPKFEERDDDESQIENRGYNLARKCCVEKCSIRDIQAFCCARFSKTNDVTTVSAAAAIPPRAAAYGFPRKIQHHENDRYDISF